MNQRTISKAISISGIGLHTGKTASIELHPAESGTGIVFRRIDLQETPIIPADISRVISTNRGTTIQEGIAQVWTVEHLMAALTGSGIDNVRIDINGPEIPILDGSAKHFVEAIKSAGITELEAEKEQFIIQESLSFKDEETGAEYMALPSNKFEVTTLIDFNSKILGQQYATLETIDQFNTDVAPCRTFVFLHELEQLIEQNLIKGGDLDNAIVIVDRLMSQDELDLLAKKLGKPSVKVDKEGVLNTTKLQFSNEPARHKLLDVVGDLSLLGKSIVGKIVCKKPGHKSNVEFTRFLKRKFTEQNKLRNIPVYDPDKTPILDTIQIQKILPHRFPFLLVDKIIEMAPNYVIGVKNISFTDSCFQGHFPNNPVYPGVLQIEALAQTGGILAISTQKDPSGWDTYFVKIDQTKFKQKVLPGDSLIMKMELATPIKRGIVQMNGTAYVGNKLVCEAVLTAQIVKRSESNHNE